MTDTFASPRQLLDDNTEEEFIDCVDVLLKIANNVLNHPSELKYRKIRIGTETVQTKLLSRSGGMECLFEMGFEEDGEYLTLPLTTDLEVLRRLRDALKDEKERLERRQATGNQQVESAASASAAATSISVPSQNTALPGPNLNSPVTEGSTAPDSYSVLLPSSESLQSTELQMYAKIQTNSQHVLLYEDRSLQEKARLLIPFNYLTKRADEKCASMQSSSGDSEVVDVRDLLLLELLEWFKGSFFKWVDAPQCESCLSNTTLIGMVKATAEELKWGASRVENYTCNDCGNFTRFPRYNHPAKLLETRKGRCGEWANCFTLCCRAIEFEARYVLDWTDHVWTEVFSESQMRWLHCDPCENTCDKPLLYESGWGKKLTYVIAFSKDEVQDVSWRYSAKHRELLSRRDQCRESWLLNVIHRIFLHKTSTLDEERRQILLKRLLKELVEFITRKSNDGTQLSGRVSGSLAWRQARGEIGSTQAASDKYVLKLTESEIVGKFFHLTYNCAQNLYYRKSNVNAVIRDWTSLAFEHKSVFRKEEMDWNTAYLARTEESLSGSVTWMIDLTETALKIDKVEMKLDCKTFEDGEVTWEVWGDKEVYTTLRCSTEFQTVSSMHGCKSLKLTATLSGGKWNIAWQHAQLFRQSLEDNDYYPFEIRMFLC